MLWIVRISGNTIATALKIVGGELLSVFPYTLPLIFTRALGLSAIWVLVAGAVSAFAALVRARSRLSAEDVKYERH